MYKIVLLNKEGIKFEKQFESEYLYNKFLNKVKRSKTLTLISYGKEY